MIRVGEIERTWVEGDEKEKEGKCTKQRKRACNGAKGVDEALWDGGGVGVVCDIACCKLQFCCEIIIKYIMPSRLLPRSSPRCSSTIPCPRPTIPSTELATFLLVFSGCERPARSSPRDGASLLLTSTDCVCTLLLLLHPSHPLCE